MAKSSKTLARLRANLLVHLRMKGVRQGEMARALEKTEAWVSQVLSGKRAVRLDVIDRLADYFGCDPAALFDDLDAPRQEESPYALEARVLPPGRRARDADRARVVDHLWSDNQHLRETITHAAATLGPLTKHLEGVVRAATASNADTPDHPRLNGTRSPSSRRRRGVRGAGR